ncbi:hypothetical protein [Sphingobium sp. CECT 9361]|uniref:hypothetical protein n=1 Tax=Sphingobium sp. CECT 9361 TaxID=2845384 RepID=UPI001E5FE19D|nr:hypothetical protein [Sphingobium sp. CECT 9361]
MHLLNALTATFLMDETDQELDRDIIMIGVGEVASNDTYTVRGRFALLPQHADDTGCQPREVYVY